MAYINYSQEQDPSLAPDSRPWRDFVLDVLKAGEEYRPGHPGTVRGPVAPGSGDPLETNPWLTTLVGDLKPYLGTEGLSEEDATRIKNWVQSAEYSGRARDRNTLFHDPFFHALGALGVIGGALGAAGAGAGAAGAGGAAGGGSSGLLSTAAQVSPYLSYGGQGVNVLGGLTGNKALSNLGRALSYAGTATGAGGGFNWGKVIGPAISGAGKVAGGLLAGQGQAQGAYPGQNPTVGSVPQSPIATYQQLTQLAGLGQSPWARNAPWLR